MFVKENQNRKKKCYSCIRQIFTFQKGSSRKNIKTKNDKIREKKLQYKILHLSIICSTCENKNQKIFKQEELIEILKNLNWGLIKNI